MSIGNLTDGHVVKVANILSVNHGVGSLLRPAVDTTEDAGRPLVVSGVDRMVTPSSFAEK